MTGIVASLSSLAAPTWTLRALRTVAPSLAFVALTPGDDAPCIYSHATCDPLRAVLVWGGVAQLCAVVLLAAAVLLAAGPLLARRGRRRALFAFVPAVAATACLWLAKSAGDTYAYYLSITPEGHTYPEPLSVRWYPLLDHVRGTFTLMGVVTIVVTGILAAGAILLLLHLSPRWPRRAVSLAT